MVASNEIEQAVAESDLEKELLDLIECVICLDTPTQSIHIYQCENGHLCCGECLKKWKNCSVCRKSLTEKSRNLMIEKVLSVLKSYQRSKKESKSEFPLNNNAKKVLEPAAEKIMTEKSKPGPEIQNEDWCQVVKKNVKVNHQDSTTNVNAKVLEQPLKKVITGQSKSEIQNEDYWCQVVKKKKKVITTNHHQGEDTTLSENGNFNFFIEEKKDENQEITRIRISNKFAGLILAEHNGSSIIKDIRSSSKARIKCNDSVEGNKERILTICGTKNQIQRAQYLLLRADEGIITGKETKKMNISQNVAGYLLGNRSAIMREIEFDSKADIFIMDSDEVDTDERILVISGTSKQIQRAKFLIQNPSGLNNEKQTIQLAIPCGMAGTIIGCEGRRIRGMEVSSKARLHLDDPKMGTKKR